MLKIKLAILSLTTLFFLTSPLKAAELSCPEGGAPMPVQYGDVVNCSIESSGDLDVYAITANEGDFISANITYTAGEDDDCKYFQPTLRGLDKDNEQLAISSAVRCSGTRIEFKVDKAGIYRLTAADRLNQNMGDYQVEFQCISGTCIGKSLIPKPECTATFDGAKLKLPHLEFDSKTFWVDFKLISNDPIQVEVTTAGEK